jgi:hypothetical protein
MYGNNLIKTHAEIDALKKIESMIKCKKIKKKKMNLIVLRINKSGLLCESAPCYHCTIELQKNQNIIIDKLFFSRADGTITCIKFSDWVVKDNYHVSKGWRWVSKRNIKKS